jgi:hypothetical protein
VPAEVRVFEDATALVDVLAAEVLARYARSDSRFLLGCPGGRSLRTTYRALAARPPLDRLVVVMMDEYLGGLLMRTTAAAALRTRSWCASTIAPSSLRPQQDVVALGSYKVDIREVERTWRYLPEYTRTPAVFNGLPIRRGPAVPDPVPRTNASTGRLHEAARARLPLRLARRVRLGSNGADA